MPFFEALKAIDFSKKGPFLVYRGGLSFVVENTGKMVLQGPLYTGDLNFYQDWAVKDLSDEGPMGRDD